MVAQAPKSILVVDNKNGRNEQFLPLFTAMNKAGYGKLNDKHYIINSTMQIQQNSESNMAFSLIQHIATTRGFNYVMYNL